MQFHIHQCPISVPIWEIILKAKDNNFNQFSRLIWKRWEQKCGKIERIKLVAKINCLKIESQKPFAEWAIYILFCLRKIEYLLGIYYTCTKYFIGLTPKTV
jgi:hypothetical protein